MPLLPIQKQILMQTNVLRQGHSLPPVAWDFELANRVQAYANTCPGKFQHCQI